MRPRPKVALVTPFLDRRHGTERCLAEQVERLAKEFDIHIYTHKIRDLDPGRAGFTVHRIPAVPGPHLIRYVWFFAANRMVRLWHRVWRRLTYRVVFSPCINCMDADLIAVHVLFHTLSLMPGDRTGRVGLLRLLHRRIYYALLRSLERRIYGNPGVNLVCVSDRVRRELSEAVGRRVQDDAVVRNGVDPQVFHPARRAERRGRERRRLGLDARDTALLLIGNDMAGKGLPVLLRALRRVDSPRVKGLVVTGDDTSAYRDETEDLRSAGVLVFLRPGADVMAFYAAADIYVAPSAVDAFGLPPLEAMACGLPVVVSANAGVAEILTDGVDGFLLRDPGSASELAAHVDRLACSPDLREDLGARARRTACGQTWEANARRMGEVIRSLLPAAEEEPVTREAPCAF
jgi:UDP-glucose:(heptosyl)LPS alpha-1,3-glucosyltransferase